jgi:hypothetical protein
MPLQPSNDFGAQDFDGTGVRKVHNHRFPGSNTGLFFLLKDDPRYKQHAPGLQKSIDLHANFLRGTAPDGSDRKVRIDLFGLKPGDTLDAGTVTQLRPELPRLQPGKSYVVEVVVRTLGLGHPLTQGTVDSNELWVDFRATSGGREIARNGATANPDDSGPVDPWSHFINVLMLDRHGNRINRRNPQDIFTPLYNKQIGPGAAAVLHYRLDVPANVTGPVEVTARVRYRKFDYEYMKLVHEGKEPPKLPIVDLCEDKVTLPVEGLMANVPPQTSPVKPAWQRWNDYGIGCLLEGGGKRGHFRQAEEAFRKLLTLGEKDAVPQGHLNLARLYIEEGRLDDAAVELEAAGKCDPPAAPWSRAWFGAIVNSGTATRKEHLDAVIADLEKLLDPNNQPQDRKFDFSKDYVAWNVLANRLYKRRDYERDDPAARRQYLLRAVKAAETVLSYDSENVEAHDLLMRCYAELGSPVAPADAGAPNPEWFSQTAQAAADPKGPKAGRVEACGKIVNALPKLPAPKLASIREALAKLRPAFHAEQDPEVQAALAAALAALHRESHAIYKPDEVAQSNATQIYREKNPVANYTARDRVVYPTAPDHRESILKTGELPAAR